MSVHLQVYLSEWQSEYWFKRKWDWKILQFYHFARAFNGLFTKARRSKYHQEQVFTDQNYSVDLNFPVKWSVDPWPGVASIISNHATLEDAKTECLENPECDGITKIGSDYTVRRGAVLFSYGPSTSYMKSLVHWSDEYTGQSSVDACVHVQVQSLKKKYCSSLLRTRTRTRARLRTPIQDISSVAVAWVLLILLTRRKIIV